MLFAEGILTGGIKQRYGWMWEKVTMSQSSQSIPNLDDLFRFRRSPRRQARPGRSPRRRRPKGGRSTSVSTQSTQRISIDYFKWFPGKTFIRKTSMKCIYPCKPHFYIEKLGFAGVYLIFLFLIQNIHCGYSLEPPH